MPIEDYLHSNSNDGIKTGIVGLVGPNDNAVGLVATLPVGMDGYYTSLWEQLNRFGVTLVPVVDVGQNSLWDSFLDRFDPMALLVSDYVYFCRKVAMEISRQIRASGTSNPPRIATVFDKIYGDGSLSRKNPDMPTDIIPVPVRAQNDRCLSIFSLPDPAFWRLKKTMESANYATFIESLILREEIAARPFAYRIGEEILLRLSILEQQGIKSVAIASSPRNMPYIEQRLQSGGFKRSGEPNKYVQALPPIPKNRGANSYMTNSLPAPYSGPAFSPHSRPAFGGV